MPIWTSDGYQAVFFYRPYMVDALNHSSPNHKKRPQKRKEKNQKKKKKPFGFLFNSKKIIYFINQ